MPTVAHWERPTYALRATVGNLRLNHERRLVDQNSASWNRVVLWMRQLDGLIRAS